MTVTSNNGDGDRELYQLSSCALYTETMLECCDAESAAGNMIEVVTLPIE